ncbi:MAG: hypothetical protein GC137_08670 [Alphaproteobacteria bacterium]|nr:hypothetical protein [Alphaproteobacteria bacterium]
MAEIQFEKVDGDGEGNFWAEYKVDGRRERWNYERLCRVFDDTSKPADVRAAAKQGIDELRITDPAHTPAP